MENPYIYISYASEDREIALEVESLLNDFTINHFIDRQLRYGDDYKATFEAHIKRAHFLIVLVSKLSLESKWVQHEVKCAKEQNKTIIPIIIESLTETMPNPAFNLDRHAISIQNGKLSAKQLCDALIAAGIADDGIIPIGLYRHTGKHDLTDEVFCIELLRSPIAIVRNAPGEITARFNRCNVKHILYSDQGKKNLTERYIIPNASELFKKDIALHKFITGSNTDPVFNLTLENYPMRWISGGVLPIVTFRDKRWIPMFYRDKDPSGWNIPLGSSERDKSSVSTAGHSVNLEHENLWRLQLREFIEESLILSKAPAQGGENSWRPFDIDLPDVGLTLEMGRQWTEEHLRKRGNIPDNLRFHEGTGIKLKFPGLTDFSVEVSHNRCDKPVPSHDVLFAINMLELGIEIVRIASFALDNDNYLLDGEALGPFVNRVTNEIDSELVRMPFGLISLDYLCNTFGGSQLDLENLYDEEQHVMGSLDLDQKAPFKEGDTHVFQWDLIQREFLMDDPNATSSEKTRYRKWSEGDGKRFEIGAVPPARFTPATAKLIHAFLHGSEFGRSILERYRKGRL